MVTRTFETKTATREQVPIIVGLMGPSGSGKTFSMLRLATGIQRVTGGDIHIIDTEARRALHYADRFKFKHTSFEAPFSPMDYLQVVEHCLRQGAKIIGIDSMSHEHEGPGGVLEMHDEETERLMKEWKVSRGKAQISAWGEPKKQRTRFINTMLQMQCNFIWCFRAAEKIKVLSRQEKRQGDEDIKDIKDIGFQPIGSAKYVYETTVCTYLPPGSCGQPLWVPDKDEERRFVKKPEQFIQLFEKHSRLSEAHGEVMARWASGENVPDVIAKMKSNSSKSEASQPDPPPPSDTNGDT